jgi:hypothetical protein
MMDLKTLIDRNFSRKAEVVVVTEVAIVVLARTLTAETDAAVAAAILPVVRLAMWIVGAIGLAGITAQAVLDWKWPKNRSMENFIKRLNRELPEAGPAIVSLVTAETPDDGKESQDEQEVPQPAE